MSFADIARVCVAYPNLTQCILFLFVLVLLWVCERAATGQLVFDKLRHTFINVTYMAGVVPVQLTVMIACIAVANWTGRHHWGLVYLLPHPESPWIRLGVMFFALDFLDYVYHYAAHRLPWLWKLHLVHHTDRAVDVSTTFREHPGETFVRVCTLTLWVFICGASVEALIFRQTFETFSNISQHTAFRLTGRPARIMGWIFITPNLHHAHHNWKRPGTNCNYGDVLSIWDRMFGTYVDIAGEEITFGLDSHMDSNQD